MEINNSQIIRQLAFIQSNQELPLKSRIEIFRIIRNLGKFHSKQLTQN